MGMGGAEKRTGEAEAASAIVHWLGGDPWTITREVKRDILPSGGHPPVHAEGCYLVRRPPAKPKLTSRPRTLTAKHGTRPGSRLAAATPRAGILTLRRSGMGSPMGISAPDPQDMALSSTCSVELAISAQIE